MSTQPAPRSVCATCRFQDLVNMQGQIMRQMVCYRFPPNVSMVTLPQGVQATSMFPVVQPTWHCYEWAPRVEPDTIQRGETEV